MSTTTGESLREQVRERYAEAARQVDGSGSSCGSGSCCADGSPGDFGEALYSAEQRGELPDTAVLASLGCGNPTAVAELHEGETVLDLGSGGGIDVILSAKRVGPAGVAYGVDMTDEMLALARKNAAEAGVTNVHFLKGVIEQIPLPADSVDVVISNCVINLSVDKAAVLTEMARVLKPGGRIGVSDVVAEDHLSGDERAERGSYVGCIAGALSRSEYVAGLEAAGFEDVSVEFTHEVADGMHGAIVKATKTREPASKNLPVVEPARARRLLLRAWATLPKSCSSASTTPAAARWRPASSSSAPAARSDVRSAGSAPGEEINPAVVEAMAELGVDLSEEFPKPLTDESVRAADVVITMGCGDACPIYPGKRYEDWELEDPAGKDLETVRRIRDEIDERVQRLVTELTAA